MKKCTQSQSPNTLQQYKAMAVRVKHPRDFETLSDYRIRFVNLSATKTLTSQLTLSSGDWPELTGVILQHGTMIPVLLSYPQESR